MRVPSDIITVGENIKLTSGSAISSLREHHYRSIIAWCPSPSFHIYTGAVKANNFLPFNDFDSSQSHFSCCTIHACSQNGNFIITPVSLSSAPYFPPWYLLLQGYCQHTDNWLFFWSLKVTVLGMDLDPNCSHVLFSKNLFIHLGWNGIDIKIINSNCCLDAALFHSH